MNSSWRFLAGLLSIGLLAPFSAAQAPGDALVVTQLPPASSAPALEAPPALMPLDSYLPAGSAAPSNRLGLCAGVGLYVIQPYFQNNPAYTVFLEQTQNSVLDPQNPATITVGEQAIRANVRHHMDVAPLLWLGYMGEEGFGGRVRWWTFRQGTTQSVSLPPFAGVFRQEMQMGHPVIVASGTLLTVTSAAPLGLMAFGDTLGLQHGAEGVNFNVTTKLAVQVGDLEAVQSLRSSGWDLLLAGGLRLARIDQAYNAYDSQTTSPIELRTLLSSYRFEGLGPTLALEVRRTVGETGVSVYSLVRGSLVFGSAQQNASFGGQELRNDDPNPQLASQHRNRALPMGELEVGVELEDTASGSGLFGQLGLVGQNWFGAGSASRSTMLTPMSTLRPVQGGASIDSNIAFFGLIIRVGLNY